LLAGTRLTYDVVPIDPARGTVPLAALEQQATVQAEGLAGIAFPQVNSLGCLEDVDGLTDLAHRLGARAIVVTDPMLLASGGLKAPGTFGQEGEGADILVGEAQHLAIPPHYGGPGLGVFGMRYYAAHQQDIRQAPGRFVGDAQAGRGMTWCGRAQISRSQSISNGCRLCLPRLLICLMPRPPWPCQKFQQRIYVAHQWACQVGPRTSYGRFLRLCQSKTSVPTAPVTHWAPAR